MIFRTATRTTAWFPTEILVCAICSHGFLGMGRAAYCPPCRPEALKFIGHAHYLVNKEVKNGNLKPATQFKCVDCGAKAKIYEHRDYGDPLNVVPACTKCNNARWNANRFGEFGRKQLELRRSERR